MRASDVVHTTGNLFGDAENHEATVSRLRAYSDHVRRQLSDYEATKVFGTPIRIERRCTDAVVEAARAGSLLLVGEPGAGKSAVINASAAKLKEQGHDVLELAVDRLPVNTLPELSAELGLSHPLRDVLLSVVVIGRRKRDQSCYSGAWSNRPEDHRAAGA